MIIQEMENTILILLTLLHSEQPKLYGVLAVLSAVGLKPRGFCSLGKEGVI